MGQNKVLVTGSAGFIGFHLCSRLIKDSYLVTGIDNINSYYDIKLKQDRLLQLGINLRMEISGEYNQFRFIKQDILDKKGIDNLFKEGNFTHVIHLAAQAGVRHSIINPQLYLDNNIQGFFNILESCRRYPPRHLIFASSSSVYGLNRQMPLSTSLNTDNPISFYAVTKKTNELMAYLYAHLHGIPCTGLRFFTVYGPWGRPDMAYFDFTEKIINGKPIEIYNNGNLMRDFTYIDDIINGIAGLIEKPPVTRSQQNLSNNEDNSFFQVPIRLMNIGGHNPVNLIDFVNVLEKLIGIRAKKIFKTMQPGDVNNTFADITDLTDLTGFHPSITLEEGLMDFIKWYRGYYNL